MIQRNLDERSNNEISVFVSHKDEHFGVKGRKRMTIQNYFCCCFLELLFPFFFLVFVN